jgi:hypothetical protein
MMQSSILSLHKVSPDAVGGVWWKFPGKISPFHQMDWVTTFSFRVQVPPGQSGADGFAFVIQKYSATALGEGGSGMGYAGIPQRYEYASIENNK